MRRRLSLLLVFAVLAAVAVPFAAAETALPPPGPPIVVDEYWQRVDQALAAVRAAKDLGGAERGTRLEAAAAALDGVDAVVLPDGTVAAIDNRPLVARLRASEPDLDALDQDLTALMRAGSSQLKPPPYEDAAAQLAAILARPEFQYPPPSPLQEAWNRIVNTILSWLFRLLLSELFRWAITVLAVLLLLALIAYILRDVITGGFAGGGRAAADDLADEHLSALQAQQRAQSLAAGGDFRSAVRYQYLSVLLFLEEAGRLRYDRSLTNREYLRQVAAQADLSDPFRAVVITVDRVWYGFVPLDAAGYESFLGQVQAVRGVRIA